MTAGGHFHQRRGDPVALEGEAHLVVPGTEGPHGEKLEGVVVGLLEGLDDGVGGPGRIAAGHAQSLHGAVAGKAVVALEHLQEFGHDVFRFVLQRLAGAAPDGGGPVGEGGQQFGGGQVVVVLFVSGARRHGGVQGRAGDRRHGPALAGEVDRLAGQGVGQQAGAGGVPSDVGVLAASFLWHPGLALIDEVALMAALEVMKPFEFLHERGAGGITGPGGARGAPDETEVVAGVAAFPLVVRGEGGPGEVVGGFFVAEQVKQHRGH